MDSRVDQLLSQAHFLATEFDQGGRTMRRYIDEAIVLDREALELCLPGHERRASSLTRLSFDLVTRYEQLGAICDIEEGILFDQEALALRPQGHPDRWISLNNLARCLSIRYDQLGVVSDLDEAIVLSQEALALRPQGHPDRSMSLNNTALYLSTRYMKSGMISDLNDAIVLGRESLMLNAQGHPDRSLSLNNLAFYLSTRYDRLGGVSDLDEAIVLDKEALALRQRSHPLRSMSLSNLAVDLTTRYNQLGAVHDLDEAIVFGREALALRPPGHPHRSMSLSNVAHHLSIRHDTFGAIHDLDEAIFFCREALGLRQQGHPLRSMSLSNLAVYLTTRYERFSAVYDLDEAIVFGQEAIALRSQGHPNRSMSLNNVAHCLFTRYSQFGAIHDLDEAIVLGQEALALSPLGHPDRWRTLRNLAHWLSDRHSKLGTMHDLDKSQNDFDEAFRLYSQFADVSYTATSGDLDGCRSWIYEAEEFKHSSTCYAYETYLRLLVEHLSLLPSLPRHLVILKKYTSSLAVDAFSACLRNDAPRRAVELLEQGRSVFWNQLTRLRVHSSLDGVIASGPTGEILAKQFTDLSALIHNALHSLDEDQHDHVCHLTSEMQGIVSAIRELPGFSRFLLPSLFSDLQHAASEGPVIIVNASQYGCDALIIIDGRDPIHVPLSITKEYVQLLSSKFLGLPKHGNLKDVTLVLGVILRELWEMVVFPVVNILQPIRPSRSRIWWCPTAEFSDLPLHAAGPYRRGQDNLPDIFISSYTPTLGALIRARRIRAPKPATEAKRFLAVGQANAVGERKLLSVSSELTSIGKDVGSAAIFRKVEGEESRISLVKEELGKNEWVHLACHGLPNRKEPFKSAFALRDGHFTIEQIIRGDLENPEFAYLSACRTTVGDEESPDESIHLAAAMQFLGFRSVIGTMWSVDDSATNAITSRFYKHMLDESGHLDYTRAAFALNETMRTVPKSEVTADQRVLYIHLGV